METDLFENWNRYYDPATGRYLQPEPMMLLQPKAAVWPAYSYAKNNPVSFTDPTGLFTVGDRLSQCPTFNIAQERARKMAGCDPSGTNSSSSCNRCQNAIKACDSGCNVCESLRTEAGPDAAFVPKGPVTVVPRDSALFLNGYSGDRAIQIAENWVLFRIIDRYDFNTALCTPEMIDILAPTPVHEAMHQCNIGKISDDRTKPSKSGCSAEALELVCAGEGGANGRP
ncbi:RHS repeat-associated core domain-containing protein [Myxococcus sp. CA040A]|uniref:RHS repeat-associated core domain-containing protein n=1 Tax=Myxococcus sp. CA040A TaxID=2741738 RepID=UPI00157A7C3B|nr:RHS repeat-associated core domain-containing protein [Myxococcus sp. CA040A]